MARSEEDQQKHRQQYKHVLEVAARERTIELANQMQGPIIGIRPFRRVGV
jgi:hypothetical protein